MNSVIRTSLLGAIFLSGTVHGAKEPPTNSCAAQVGQLLTFANFDEVYASLPKFEGKSQFETTKAFQSRLNALLVRPQNEVAFLRQRHFNSRELDGVMYDADKQVLTVYGWAFTDSRNKTPAWVARAVGSSTPLKPAAMTFEIGWVDEDQEPYQANNAFGAGVKVSVKTRETTAILEKSENATRFFKNQKDLLVVAKLPMAPDAAKRILMGKGAALSIIPSYSATGSDYTAPTMQFPRERRDNIRAIVGDVRCGYLLWDDGKVAYAFEVD